MKGEEVRERILEEHAELRSMLGDLERLMEQSAPFGSAFAEELERSGLALYAKLAAHLETEDGVLVPALRAAGATGRQRAEQLLEEHGEQRELLAFLIERLSRESRPTVLIISELRTFIECVREDMEDEETNLLGHEILGGARRDDHEGYGAPQ